MVAVTTIFPISLLFFVAGATEYKNNDMSAFFPEYLLCGSFMLGACRCYLVGGHMG